MIGFHLTTAVVGVGGFAVPGTHGRGRRSFCRDRFLLRRRDSGGNHGWTRRVRSVSSDRSGDVHVLELHDDPGRFTRVGGGWRGSRGQGNDVSGDQTPANFERVHGNNLTGIGTRIEDVADAVAYLANAENVTGALIPVDGLMAYGMSKLALEHLTLDAARELHPQGTNVNCFRIDV